MEIGRTIRKGKYEVVSAYSAALGRALLAFRSEEGTVVGFIHPGGQEAHVANHVLIGMDRAVDIVVDSRRAYRELEERVNEADALFNEVVTIEVKPFELIPA